MAISNSYVKLPEGSWFTLVLWRCSREWANRLTRGSGDPQFGKEQVDGHQLSQCNEGGASAAAFVNWVKHGETPGTK